MHELLSPLLIGLALCLAAGDAEPAPTTSVHLIEARQIEAIHLEKIESAGLRLLRSANFNTIANADILKQSVPRRFERYREALARDYVLIRYDKPATIHTTAGDTKVYELLIAIGPQYANAVFTVDESGQLVAHEKYSGEIAVELRDAVYTGR